MGVSLEMNPRRLPTCIVVNCGAMVLVFGGAGYVGSHVAKKLRKSGITHTVVDNLEQGHLEAVCDSPFHKADLRDPDSLASVFRLEPEAILIFAGYISVGESYKNPAKYYENNVGGVLNLLGEAVRAGVKRIVFSSSAAVYGEPESVPIPESHPMLPTNPYGETKRVIENFLKWMAAAHGIRSVSLRYFNAAGADPEGELGEDHDPEEHLIPLAIDAALGRRPGLTVFGADYPTQDGTCVRDYVHVDDLADAHLRALSHMEANDGALALNLGSETGFSVKQVIDVVSQVAGTRVPHTEGKRRMGDPATLVASCEKAKTDLGWSPKHPDLQTMVAHALAWREKHPAGYGP